MASPAKPYTVIDQLRREIAFVEHGNTVNTMALYILLEEAGLADEEKIKAAQMKAIERLKEAEEEKTREKLMKRRAAFLRGVRG